MFPDFNYIICSFFIENTRFSHLFSEGLESKKYTLQRFCCHISKVKYAPQENPTFFPRHIFRKGLVFCHTIFFAPKFFDKDVYSPVICSLLSALKKYLIRRHESDIPLNKFPFAPTIKYNYSLKRVFQ